MHLELTEQMIVRVPPGTEQAIVEVATRREVSPDEFIRNVVLKELQKCTGYSATARAREAQRQN